MEGLVPSLGIQRAAGPEDGERSQSGQPLGPAQFCCSVPSTVLAPNLAKGDPIVLFLSLPWSSGETLPHWNKFKVLLVACAAVKEAVHHLSSILGFADETTKQFVQGASLG